MRLAQDQLVDRDRKRRTVVEELFVVRQVRGVGELPERRNSMVKQLTGEVVSALRLDAVSGGFLA